MKINEKPENTREENYIAHYLDENDISHEPQYETEKLSGDSKSYRRVDFYLENLNIYVEYMGMYNESKVDRERYEEKRIVYFKNSMPTLLLKPHDLGILDYAFHTKVLRILRHNKFRKPRRLMRYKLNRFINKKGLGSFFSTLLYSYLLIVLVTYPTELEDGVLVLLQIAVFVALMYHVGGFIKSIYKYLIKDY